MLVNQRKSEVFWASSYTRLNQHQNERAICAVIQKELVKALKVWNQSIESMRVKTTKLFLHRKRSDHKLWRKN